MTYCTYSTCTCIQCYVYIHHLIVIIFHPVCTCTSSGRRLRLKTYWGPPLSQVHQRIVNHILSTISILHNLYVLCVMYLCLIGCHVCLVIVKINCYCLLCIISKIPLECTFTVKPTHLTLIALYVWVLLSTPHTHSPPTPTLTPHTHTLAHPPPPRGGD